MCGIAGIIAPELDREQRETALTRMISRQRHRGPDDSGFVTRGPASIGMARLAIIDPANGSQPMSSPDGRYHLVFNGAIYNHQELRASLQHEWAFRTHCDTEVLLAAFVHHGPACLPRLRGMFAFAVWDAEKQTLFAARDPLGIKPLYYAHGVDRSLSFASELNALLAGGLVGREIDPVSVGEYLAWFSVPAPRTLYRDIANLLPGHSLQLDRTGRLQVQPWWQLPSPQSQGIAATNRHEFIHGLRAQLQDSIRAHRVADVPVGAFLSGGLDSTAVAALMVQSGARRLKTFSIGFNEAGYAEQKAATAVAKFLGCEHHTGILTGARLAADLPSILSSLDQPTGDGINTWYASRLAHQGGVKVALSGLGGDELFGGYPSFRQLPRLQQLLPWWRRLPAGLRQRTLGLLRSRSSTRLDKLSDFLTHAQDLHELASLQRRVLSEPARLTLLSADARPRVARFGPHHPRLEQFAFDLHDADPFQVISAWELRTYMADVLLRDSDVMSMSHSLELRVPFIDAPLLDWLWPQPTRWKYDATVAKSALADAVDGLLPDFVRNRPKQGFTLPFPLWMRAELKPFLDDCFSSSALTRCPWLDATAAERLWAGFQQAGDNRAWSRVWSVAMLIAFANRPTE